MAKLLENLTIRELIIELAKADEVTQTRSADQLECRQATRWERAIVQELRRRRDEPLADRVQSRTA